MKSGLKYHTINPGSDLAHIVRFYYVLEGHFSGLYTYTHRVLANFSPELIFHYGGALQEILGNGKTEKTFLSGIHAQTSGIRQFSINQNMGIFGVFLQPYAIPVLFGVPSTAITNELPDLHSLLGSEGKELEEQMISAQNTAQRINMINRFLKQRLSTFNKPEIVHASQVIYKARGHINALQLAEQSCLSVRQFQRNFKEHIGFTPKSFARLVRFRALLHTYSGKQATLTQIAHDFGYHDQSHFIHDFKRFSGYNPKSYFSGKAQDVFYAP